MKHLPFLFAASIFILQTALQADNIGIGLTTTKSSSTQNSKSSNEQNKSCTKSTCNPKRWSFEVRGAAFIPLKQQLRDIYGSALPTLEIESSYSLCKNLWASCDKLLLWENVGWTSKSGKSLGFGYYSKLNLVPISLGIEYQVRIVRNFDFYIGIGPTYSFLRIENKDDFTTSHLKRNQFGFTTKTGFRYTFLTHLFIDIFADYYYTQFHQMHNSIQTIDNHFSGFYVGGGFGGKW